MPIYKTDNKPFAGPHVLDNPPPFHEKLCDYGERPYWSPDGSKIAFIENNYGDICEMDFATRKVRNLTKGLGEHHSFLRVLYLPNGDFLLIGRTSTTSVPAPSTKPTAMPISTASPIGTPHSPNWYTA